MLKHIVQYLNTRLLTTGYFKSLYEYVELKPQKDNGSAPMMYCSNGEWKDIDTEKNVSYIRLLRPIAITEGTNTRVSGETLLNISIALRIVGIVRNTSDDDSYKWANLAFDMSKVISDTSANLTTILNARMVDVIPSALHINTVDVFKAEFPGNSKSDIPYKYTMAAVDLNVSVEITSTCWALLCGDTVTDCDVLLAGLTKQEKNECILPSYFFSDTDVQNNVTAEQQQQLEDWLCTPAAPVNVSNSTDSYSVNVACGGSLELPDNTYNFYVNGVLRGTSTGASIENTTINIRLS